MSSSANKPFGSPGPSLHPTTSTGGLRKQNNKYRGTNNCVKTSHPHNQHAAVSAPSGSGQVTGPYFGSPVLAHVGQPQQQHPHPAVNVNPFGVGKGNTITNSDAWILMNGATVPGATGTSGGVVGGSGGGGKKGGGGGTLGSGQGAGLATQRTSPTLAPAVPDAEMLAGAAEGLGGGAPSTTSMPPGVTQQQQQQQQHAGKYSANQWGPGGAAAANSQSNSSTRGGNHEGAGRNEKKKSFWGRRNQGANGAANAGNGGLGHRNLSESSSSAAEQQESVGGGAAGGGNNKSWKLQYAGVLKNGGSASQQHGGNNTKLAAAALEQETQHAEAKSDAAGGVWGTDVDMPARNEQKNPSTKGSGSNTTQPATPYAHFHAALLNSGAVPVANNPAAQAQAHQQAALFPYHAPHPIHALQMHQHLAAAGLAGGRNFSAAAFQHYQKYFSSLVNARYPAAFQHQMQIFYQQHLHGLLAGQISGHHLPFPVQHNPLHVGGIPAAGTGPESAASNAAAAGSFGGVISSSTGGAAPARVGAGGNGNGNGSAAAGASASSAASGPGGGADAAAPVTAGAGEVNGGAANLSKQQPGTTSTSGKDTRNRNGSYNRSRNGQNAAGRNKYSDHQGNNRGKNRGNNNAANAYHSGAQLRKNHSASSSGSSNSNHQHGTREHGAGSGGNTASDTSSSIYSALNGPAIASAQMFDSRGQYYNPSPMTTASETATITTASSSNPAGSAGTTLAQSGVASQQQQHAGSTATGSTGVSTHIARTSSVRGGQRATGAGRHDHYGSSYENGSAGLNTYGGPHGESASHPHHHHSASAQYHAQQGYGTGLLSAGGQHGHHAHSYRGAAGNGHYNPGARHGVGVVSGHKTHSGHSTQGQHQHHTGTYDHDAFQSWTRCPTSFRYVDLALIAQINQKLAELAAAFSISPARKSIMDSLFETEIRALVEEVLALHEVPGPGKDGERKRDTVEELEADRLVLQRIVNGAKIERQDAANKERASIRLFGSCVNGSATNESDYDCGIRLPQRLREHFVKQSVELESFPERARPYNFPIIRALRKLVPAFAGRGDFVCELIEEARVPVLRVCVIDPAGMLRKWRERASCGGAVSEEVGGHLGSASCCAADREFGSREQENRQSLVGADVEAQRGPGSQDSEGDGKHDLRSKTRLPSESEDAIEVASEATAPPQGAAVAGANEQQDTSHAVQERQQQQQLPRPPSMPPPALPPTLPMLSQTGRPGWFSPPAGVRGTQQRSSSEVLVGEVENHGMVQSVQRGLSAGFEEPNVPDLRSPKEFPPLRPSCDSIVVPSSGPASSGSGAGEKRRVSPSRRTDSMPSSTEGAAFGVGRKGSCVSVSTAGAAGGNMRDSDFELVVRDESGNPDPFAEEDLKNVVNVWGRRRDSSFANDRNQSRSLGSTSNGGLNKFGGGGGEPEQNQDALMASRNTAISSIAAASFPDGNAASSDVLDTLPPALPPLPPNFDLLPPDLGSFPPFVSSLAAAAAAPFCLSEPGSGPPECGASEGEEGDAKDTDAEFVEKNGTPKFSKGGKNLVYATIQVKEILGMLSAKGKTSEEPSEKDAGGFKGELAASDADNDHSASVDLGGGVTSVFGAEQNGDTNVGKPPYPLNMATSSLSHLDNGKAKFDISVANEDFVFENSRLLQLYINLQKPVFGALTILLKRYFKRRGIANAKDGFLSSYSHQLLFIHFLQRKKLLPHLQDPELVEKWENEKRQYGKMGENQNLHHGDQMKALSGKQLLQGSCTERGGLGCGSTAGSSGATEGGVGSSGTTSSLAGVPVDHSSHCSTSKEILREQHMLQQQTARREQNKDKDKLRTPDTAAETPEILPDISALTVSPESESNAAWMRREWIEDGKFVDYEEFLPPTCLDAVEYFGLCRLELQQDETVLQGFRWSDDLFQLFMEFLGYFVAFQPDKWMVSIRRPRMRADLTYYRVEKTTMTTSNSKATACSSSQPGAGSLSSAASAEGGGGEGDSSNLKPAEDGGSKDRTAGSTDAGPTTAAAVEAMASADHASNTSTATSEATSATAAVKTATAPRTTATRTQRSFRCLIPDERSNFCFKIEDPIEPGRILGMTACRFMQWHFRIRKDLEALSANPMGIFCLLTEMEQLNAPGFAVGSSHHEQLSLSAQQAQQQGQHQRAPGPYAEEGVAVGGGAAAHHCSAPYNARGGIRTGGVKLGATTATSSSAYHNHSAQERRQEQEQQQQGVIDESNYSMTICGDDSKLQDSALIDESNLESNLSSWMPLSPRNTNRGLISGAGGQLGGGGGCAASSGCVDLQFQ